MTCYKPLKAYWSKELNPSGKRGIVFDGKHGFIDRPLDLPCGQCIGCRLERVRQWAIRCLHESQMHDENCFITLTYNDENLPEYSSLVKSHFQRFMKRLRRKFPYKKIKYFHCGEYGEKKDRPHYHACLFGISFPDSRNFKTGKGFIKCSSVLKDLWPYGNNFVGDVTFESACYVASYIIEKVKGQFKDKAYERICKSTGELVYIEPEYATMSRGGNVLGSGGIGKIWLDKYSRDTYNTDSVVIRGKEVKPPKYYDSKFEAINKEFFDRIKGQRINSSILENSTPERLKEREKIALWRTNLKRRNFQYAQRFENGKRFVR